MLLARICSGWFKFRSLASFLTPKDVSLLLRGKIMKHVYGVVCYTEVRCDHRKAKMNWHCIRQK